MYLQNLTCSLSIITVIKNPSISRFSTDFAFHDNMYGQANPIACAASLESARLIENGQGNTWFDPSAFNGFGGVRPSFTEADIQELSLLQGVKGVMSLGSVLSVELSNSSVEVVSSTVTTTNTVAHGIPSSPNSVESSTSSDTSSNKNARY